MNSGLDNINQLFIALWAEPLLQTLGVLFITLLVYILARRLYAFSKQNALLNPLVTCTVIICSALYLLDFDVTQFTSSLSLLDLLLGPATVALAVPLYNQIPVIQRLGVRVLAPIIIAGTIAPILGWGTMYLLDTSKTLQMTMLVKSITTPLAMETTALIGGLPELAAVFVILTGIVGATFAPWLIMLTNTRSEYAMGLALGSVAHVVGTTKALSISETCGAFATLGLCINGIATAIVLPLLFA